MTLAKSESTTPPSSTASASKDEDAILIDSNDDNEEGAVDLSQSSSSSSSVDAENVRNVQAAARSSRPKRLIHYQKPDYKAEYARYFGTSLGGAASSLSAAARAAGADDDEDEEDEDYVLSSTSSSGDDDDHDDENSSSDSSSSMDSTSSNTDNNEQRDQSQLEKPKKTKTKTKKRDGSYELMKSQDVNSTRTNEKNDEINKGNKKGNKEKIGDQQAKKKKKKTNKKFKATKGDDLDSDTRKILETFKKAQIVHKPKQSHQKKAGRPSKNNATERVNVPDRRSTSTSTNQGPYVKLVKQKVRRESDECVAAYVVKSASEKEAAATAIQTAAAAGDNNQLNKMSYKLLVPRDRAPPITVVAAAGTIQHCALCSNTSNVCHLGDLFGPYRVSEGYEIDLIDHNDQNGCAVWSPIIYLKNNRILGIANAVKAAQEMKCVFCKKLGASLSCRHVECNRIYHYPCAIKNECLFNDESFSILCKIHSTK